MAPCRDGQACRRPGHLKARLGLLEAEIARVYPAFQALGVVVGLNEALARPDDAAGAIRRHQSKCGRCGAFKEFAPKVLQQVEAGLTTREIGHLAETYFRLDFGSETEFNGYLRDTIRCQLHQFIAKRWHGCRAASRPPFSASHRAFSSFASIAPPPRSILCHYWLPCFLQTNAARRSPYGRPTTPRYFR